MVLVAGGLAPTPIPQGSVAIYGWNAENINTNVANRRIARLVLPRSGSEPLLNLNRT
jgi:hypothetical protein